MAIGNSIETRISLTGGDEVRRHFEEIGAAGERSGNQIRAMLLNATSSAGNFTAGTGQAATSSGQLKFALQNLSFQANDVATSFASGISPMRVFAQQVGQIVQAFQQGGGIGTVLRAAGAGIAAMITPMTAAIAAGVVLAGGFALLIARAAGSEAAVRQFDVILKGTHNTTSVTGRQIEDAAHKFHDLGLSTAEARDAFKSFLQQGGDPRLTSQVLRIAGNLDAVLGKGSMERFIAAAAKGGEPLQEFAKQLGVIPKVADDTQKQLEAAAKATAEFNKSVQEALKKGTKEQVDETRQKTRTIEDLERHSKQQIVDLTRQRGTAEQEILLQKKRQTEEIELGAKRRVEDIHRQTSDAINEILKKRNEANAARLAEYNKQLEDAAQKALDSGKGLLDQIERAVNGLENQSLSPFQQSIRNLSTSWNELLETMSKSETITQIIKDINEMIRSITEAVKWVDRLAEAFKQTPGLPPFLGGPGEPVQSRAAGGLVYGPGTGTSDSVPIRASAGEYVSRTASVNYYGAGFYSALNRMAIPVEALRRAIPRFRDGGLVGSPAGLAFAGGGLVPALIARPGGSKTPITLVIGADRIGLEGDDAAAGRVLRVARKRALLSAGRAPS